MAKKQAGKTDALAVMETNVRNVVLKRVEELTGADELHLPQNYSPQNAVKSAWLILQEAKDKNNKLALDVCTQPSIINALLDMVIQGLNPAKSQCYFIVYGTKLVMQRSYIGAIALLKRVYGQKSRCWPQVVLEGDVFRPVIENGRTLVKEHDISNRKEGGDITHAYVVIEPDGEEPHTEVMTMGQIRRSWEQGATKGKSPAHVGFPDQMSMKTVINRGVKLLINASDDSYLLAAIERQDMLTVEAEMEAEVAEKANVTLIDVPVEPGEPEPGPAEPEDTSESDGPSSPKARFGDFTVANELDEAAARRVAAKMLNLTNDEGQPDARHLGNEHYAKILGDPDAFLAEYMAQMGSKGEPEVPAEPEHLSDEDQGALPRF